MTEREILERLAVHVGNYATILDLHADDCHSATVCKGCCKKVNDAFYGSCVECLRRIARILKAAAEGGEGC